MSALRLGMCLTGLLLALAVPVGVRADPVNGHNATPGTLTCPGFNEPVLSTSGSGAAMAIQIVTSTHVLVVKQAALLDGTVLLSHGNVASSRLTVCELDEPSIGVPVLITGVLTPAAS